MSSGGVQVPPTRMALTLYKVRGGLSVDEDPGVVARGLGNNPPTAHLS